MCHIQDRHRAVKYFNCKSSSHNIRFVNYTLHFYHFYILFFLSQSFVFLSHFLSGILKTQQTPLKANQAVKVLFYLGGFVLLLDQAAAFFPPSPNPFFHHRNLTRRSDSSSGRAPSWNVTEKTRTRAASGQTSGRRVTYAKYRASFLTSRWRGRRRRRFLLHLKSGNQKKKKKTSPEIILQ